MIDKERILARLRRCTFDFEDMVENSPAVRLDHPYKELILVSKFNTAVKRLNDAYNNRHSSHPHISRALRDAMKLANDIKEHRVGRFLEQGVQNVERYPRKIDGEDI